MAQAEELRSQTPETLTSAEAPQSAPVSKELPETPESLVANLLTRYVSCSFSHGFDLRVKHVPSSLLLFGFILERVTESLRGYGANARVTKAKIFIAYYALEIVDVY